MPLSPLGIALMMQAPNAQPRPGAVAPTDMLGAYKLSTDAANTQYLAKLQQQNALWGGLAGLGGAGMLAAPRMYSSGMFSGLFGPSAGASGAAGTDAGALGASAGLGSDAALSVMPGIAGDAAGSVGADLAAAALPAAADAGTAAFSLADILPFLFAA
jgi:hypothetical protein